MERALLEYLLSQGYDSTAAKFAEELAAKDPRMKRRASLRARTPRGGKGGGGASVAVGATSVQEFMQNMSGQETLGALGSDPGHAAAHVLFHGVHAGDPLAFDRGYTALRDWVCGSLELYRPELLALLFPVFAHCVVHLVAKGENDAARAFLARHKRDHRFAHEAELALLAQVVPATAVVCRLAGWPLPQPTRKLDSSNDETTKTKADAAVSSRGSSKRRPSPRSGGGGGGGGSGAGASTNGAVPPVEKGDSEMIGGPARSYLRRLLRHKFRVVMCAYSFELLIAMLHEGRLFLYVCVCVCVCVCDV